MPKYKGNFRCVIMSPRRLVFEDEVNSVFCQGDQGEYELLAYHYPLIGVLRKGNVIINSVKKIPVDRGIVKFFANECTVLIEDGLKIPLRPSGEEE